MLVSKQVGYLLTILLNKDESKKGNSKLIYFKHTHHLLWFVSDKDQPGKIMKFDG